MIWPKSYFGSSVHQKTGLNNGSLKCKTEKFVTVLELEKQCI